MSHIAASDAASPASTASPPNRVPWTKWEQSMNPSVVAEFLTKTASSLDPRCISETSLACVAERLRQLSNELALSPTAFPAAGPAQELVYPLAEDSQSGIALYLVSDAPGTASPPHEHGTWAVIAGIHGNEANTLYRLIDREHRRVEACRDVVVSAGKTLVLPEGAIHSTAAIGTVATYHLHLYGKSLQDLPAFMDRTYSFPRII